MAAVSGDFTAAEVPLFLEPGDGLALAVTVPSGYETGTWAANVYRDRRRGTASATCAVDVTGQVVTFSLDDSTVDALVPSGATKFSGFWLATHTPAGGDQRTWLKGDFTVSAERVVASNGTQAITATVSISANTIIVSATTAADAIAAHAAATDPHGDRAYADSGDAGKVDVAGDTMTGDLVVSGANIEVQGTGKAYRMRRSGSALDFEGGGADLWFSVWSGADFTGTQRFFLRLESGAQFLHPIGPVQFGNNGTDSVHTINPATGVASLGAKNGLSNLRFCGLSGSAGAPSTGTWATGDLMLDSAGVWHLCTAGGTPGTWT